MSESRPRSVTLTFTDDQLPTAAEVAEVAVWLLYHRRYRAATRIAALATDLADDETDALLQYAIANREQPVPYVPVVPGPPTDPTNVRTAAELADLTDTANLPALTDARARGCPCTIDMRTGQPIDVEADCPEHALCRFRGPEGAAYGCNRPIYKRIINDAGEWVWTHCTPHPAGHAAIGPATDA